MFCPNEIIPKVLFVQREINWRLARRLYSLSFHLSTNCNPFLIYTAYDRSNMLVPLVQVALLFAVSLLALFARLADIKSAVAVQRVLLKR